LKAFRFARMYICLALVWIWVFVWGIGLSIAFFFVGSHRDFLPGAVRILSRPIQWICGLKVEMQDVANLFVAETCIYMGNHQSGFDVPIFGRWCPSNLVWIVKKELGTMPFIGWVLKRTGNVLMDRKNREKAFQQIKEAAKKITDEKRRVAVFPEGTRNKTADGLLPFKRGPFFLAKAAGVPMIPVVCSSLKNVVDLRTGQLGGRVKLRVLKAVMPEGTPEQMAIQLRSLMLEAYNELNRELGNHS
jgi:1-acyl-sn-glycerol-3-phosphate acyltransferase